jgi:copper(I)-binding protein
MKLRGHFLVTMLSLLLSTPVWADDCAYLTNNKVVFSDFYARLVNRGPKMLSLYGKVVNNDSVPHVLTAVATDNAKNSNFMVYRQDGGAGNITAHTVPSITLAQEGGYKVWAMGTDHIRLGNYNAKATGKLLQFGTQYKPNTIDVTFTFSDGCTQTVSQILIRDRMND